MNAPHPNTVVRLHLVPPPAPPRPRPRIAWGEVALIALLATSGICTLLVVWELRP